MKKRVYCWEKTTGRYEIDGRQMAVRWQSDGTLVEIIDISYFVEWATTSLPPYFGSVACLCNHKSGPLKHMYSQFASELNTLAQRCPKSMSEPLVKPKRRIASPETPLPAWPLQNAMKMKPNERVPMTGLLLGPVWLVFDLLPHLDR